MSKRRAVQLLAAMTLAGCAAGVASLHRDASPPATKAQTPVARTYAKRVALPAIENRGTPPGFGKARGWLNVTRTPTEADLRGRVVVIDFWTSCCINCMHTLPILASIEKKFGPDPFLVVGVHTQKFDAEPEPSRLRAQVIRFGIAHPVAIDGDRGIWESWGVNAWPTIMVLDAKGRVVFASGGEPDQDELEAVIESALAEGADEGALAKHAATFVGREVDVSQTLAFPEKIARVAGGFAIADSGHDRIVIVDDGGKVTDIIGDGKRGNVDGTFGAARFAHPQGIAQLGDLLYVADTENHTLRAIDRKTRTVRTVAGTGSLGSGRLSGEGNGKNTPLRSPWDLVAIGDTLYVALAGSHQIATFDPKTAKMKLFAGNGNETLTDGPRLKAAFAQPSGLATDGTDLFVLDSETSSVRKIVVESGEVRTLVGHGLFVFGDVDGDGPKARLQHPIGLTYGAGALWVADTYNSKIKRVDPKSGETKTIDATGLAEPAGLALVSGSLLVADTNHARIARVSASGGSSTTFPLTGL